MTILCIYCSQIHPFDYTSCHTAPYWTLIYSRDPDGLLRPFRGLQKTQNIRGAVGPSINKETALRMCKVCDKWFREEFKLQTVAVFGSLSWENSFLPWLWMNVWLSGSWLSGGLWFQLRSVKHALLHIPWIFSQLKIWTRFHVWAALYKISPSIHFSRKWIEGLISLQ